MIGNTVLSEPFLVILISIAAWACTDSPAPSTTRPSEPPHQPTQPAENVPLKGTFAFANETGTELLSLELSVAPDSYPAAVCSEGRFPVRYVRTQSRSADTNHRQVASNFSNEPGNVFQLEDGTVTPDATCFLTTASLLPRIATIVRTLDGTGCGEQQVANLVRLAGRKALNCWRLAEIEGGSEFVAVHFANVDTTALAAVALVQDSVLLFYGLPGQYRGRGESIWRVDDGGVFDPDAVRLLFMARLPQGHAAAFLWAGAEGESIKLVVAESAAHARSVLAAYRYWSPQ